jgi:hypothetical protein
MKMKMVVALLVLASTSYFARAQTAGGLAVTVPFPFYVGSTLLPAGPYKILASGDLNQIINVSNDNGKDGARTEVVTRISASPEDRDSLVFDVAGNDHYLSEIYLQGEDGYQIKGSTAKHTHMRLKAKR